MWGGYGGVRCVCVRRVGLCGGGGCLGCVEVWVCVGVV